MKALLTVFALLILGATAGCLSEKKDAKQTYYTPGFPPPLVLKDTAWGGHWVAAGTGKITPWESFLQSVSYWAGKAALVAMLGLIVGAALGYFNAKSGAFPFWDDILIVSLIVLLVGGLLAWLATYFWWIVLVALLLAGAYWGYMLWQKKRDKVVQAETVASAELLKGFTKWTKDEKDKVSEQQSKLTRAAVAKYRAWQERTAKKEAVAKASKAG